MKKIFLYIVPAVVINLTACTYDDMKTPGYEFMPEMYRSSSYETYSTNPLFADSMASRQPVAGTIARGDAIYTDYDRLPYAYPNTIEGYEAAGSNLKNPIENNPFNFAEGKRLYDNYCMLCHGTTGGGDGIITTRNGPIPPAYSSDLLKNLPVGKMYHSMHWGKNMMGSYASQLTPTQRWKIIMYVQTLQNPQGAATTTAADSTTATADQKK